MCVCVCVSVCVCIVIVCIRAYTPQGKYNICPIMYTLWDVYTMEFNQHTLDI